MAVTPERGNADALSIFTVRVARL